MKNFRIITAILAVVGAFAFTTGCEYYKGEQGPITTPLTQDGTITDLEKRITELQGQLENPPANVDDGQIRVLQGQIEGIQRSLDELSSVEPAARAEPATDSEAVDALSEQIRTLQEQIVELQREIEALNSAETPDPGSTEPPSDEVESGTTLADVPYAALPPPDFKAPEVKHDSFLRPSGNEWGTIQLRR